ncbi:Gfo/Idh/MocA family oxidoreductase [Micromonospora sp. WMMD714]|uniref:Gfo/Idh/MocA family protein n=1 Tax=Micromonospora sp. WMMD714 TaxID=3016097 RepID=UPI00249AE688|nr:Gfo/Idh/MocA family oxidoreductase [Micromonospora sp. WMMD714]WFE64125.1 Gfo/Idh/MocA family oxidoreductase [Micromonospora sp. WMMD714]
MRVGVVGCGRHATSVLLPALVQLGFDVAAVCARRLSSAQAAAARFGARAAYADPAEMLRREGVEAVVACLPPSVYGEVIRACVEARVPVFAEKPGAGGSAEAGRLAALSAEAGVPVMVGYMKRFAPAYRQARAALADPSFGAPSLATFTFVMGDMGVGLDDYLVDNPVHHLDLARFLLGELHDLHVTRGRSDGGRHALSVAARAESGAVVSLQLGTTGSWQQHNESVEVFGSGSSVLVDNVDTCVLRPAEGPEQRWRPNYSIPDQVNTTVDTMGFGPALRHFQDVVRGTATCESDLHSAARTLALVDVIGDRLGPGRQAPPGEALG